MKIPIHWAIFAFMLATITACGYEGDGEFSTSGFWPLRNYRLELPDVAYEKGAERTFDLVGYKSHGQSLLTVTVVAENPVAFHKLRLLMSVVLTSNEGEVFRRSNSLNRHFLRMQSDGASSWPTVNEWNCDFIYPDPTIDSRAVRFDPEVEPSASTKLKCWHLIPTEHSEYQLRLNVPDLGDEIRDAAIRIELSSTWK